MLAPTDTTFTGVKLNRLFALTVFLSAFLLFQVQPLMGKAILPWYGGGPAVWTACMLFFQLVLFAGYMYAHFAVKYLPPKTLAMLHIALLAVAAITLPIIPHESLKPTDSVNPAGHVLRTLAFSVGLPYFVLAATAPLVQVWFSRTNRVGSPYRLYALSNVGSLLALLSYPFVIEPLLGVKLQGWTWSAGFVAFAAACGFSGWVAARLGKADEYAVETDKSAAKREAEMPAPNWGRRILWLALPAVASLLLLAMTNYMCQDVASLPLLWIAPLSLYLLTFILCFDSDWWYRRWLYMPGAVISCILLYFAWERGTRLRLELQVGAHLLALFTCAMVCHGELARLRPSAKYLTSFYLFVSFGGALGGIFVGLIAPMIFPDFYELYLGLLAVGLLCMVVVFIDNKSLFYRGNYYWAWAVMVALWVNAAIILVTYMRGTRSGTEFVDQQRNFYGVLTVLNKTVVDPSQAYRLLRNGRITHGSQFWAESRRRTPTQYYDPKSGVGEALLALRQSLNRPLRVGVVGLGAGTMAAYGQEGDFFKFYDINPIVPQFAEKHFTFLGDLKKAGGEWIVKDGDARLSMEQELAAKEPQNFDLIVLDAFSGDAIPMHLLTKEACKIYLEHLAPDGVLAIHISNLHLDLAPVTRALAEDNDLSAFLVSSGQNAATGAAAANWVLLSRNKTFFEQHGIGAPLNMTEKGDKPPVPWTDDHSSIWSILL
jgi:hypothetical protein